MDEYLKTNYGFIIQYIHYVYYRNFQSKSTYEDRSKRYTVLYYVLSGELECVKNDVHYTLKPNDFFFWDKNDKQKIINNSDSDCFVYVIGFHFLPVDTKHTEYNLPSYGNIDSSYFQSLFAKLHHTWNQEQKGFLPKSYSQLYNILYNIISLSNINEMTTATHFRIQKVVQYIYSEYAKDIKIEDLCKISGYSKVHMNRLFMEHYKMSPKKFINNHKITKAKELLEDTGLSVSEISNRIGISDLAYFCRLFKKITGNTPSEYKKLFLSRYL